MNIIQGAYFQDLMGQPGAVRETCRGLREEGPRVGEMGGVVALTGMGSSLHALHPLALRLNRAGGRAVVLETSELLSYGARWVLGMALVVVSQSGRSAEVVRLLERRKWASLTIGVTNDLDSPLGRRSDVVVPMRAGEEHSVSAKTYLATLCALAWLGDCFRGLNPRRAMARLESAADEIEKYLEGWERHVTELVSELEGVRRLFYLGRGTSLAAARAAGLITKEAAHFHAEGMAAAAFRHGPFELTDGSTMALIFAGSGRDRAMNEHLAQDIRAVGGRAELIGAERGIGAFALKGATKLTRPLLEILPVQMITLALAAMAGREAGHFERATKVTDVE